MAEKIRAAFIFEILGRPPEHIKESLSQLVDKLGELPGIIIDKKTVHEPKLIEDKDAKDLFTTFAEVEVLGDDINSLINVVFYAMPSHVEIIDPDETKLKNFEISALLSELTVKLHRYDEIAKTITMERNILINKVKELQAKLGETQIPKLQATFGNAVKEDKEQAKDKKSKKVKDKKKDSKKNKS